MKIADYAIRHPAVIGILLISLALFGLLSFQGMPRDLLANIEKPEVLILTVYPGASPEVVERDVTEPLEKEFSLINGIRKIFSESQDGVSMIFLTMDWDADIEAKKNDIRDKISNAGSELPEGLAGSSRLFELGTSLLPVYTCLVESTLEVGVFALLLNEEFIPRFSRLTDVSAVYARGVEEPALRVELDPGKLDAMDITALEAFAAVKRGQGSVPAGYVLMGADRLSLQSDGQYSELRQVGRQPVGYADDGNPVYLEDVAVIEMGYENPEFRTLSGGHRTVVLDIMKRPGGDTETLVAEVKNLQKSIEEETGGGIRFVPVIDNAETIGITLKSVSKSAWLGGLLAVVVLLLFLHDLRAALIVSLSIPFTIFLSFLLMRARGMSLNMMTLAGLTVSIGMIVDASIVILENTIRHRKLGRNAVEAASLGAAEVGGAVLASTSTSLSVFIPILFLSGLAGAILKEVSWVLVFALSSSAVTAIIIVPWLSARILAVEHKRGPLARFGEKFDALFDHLSLYYVQVLKIILNRKGFVLVLAAVLVAASLAVLGMLGGEFLSAPDMNEFELSVRLPAGYNLEKAEAKMAEIAAAVALEVPEIETDLWYAGLGDSAIFIESGNPIEGYGRVRLVRTVKRNRSVFDIVSHLNRVLPAKITDADITVRNGGLAKQINYATEGAGFRVELFGADWDDVLEAAGAVRILMEDDPLIERASLNVRLDRDMLSINLDRVSTGRMAVDPTAAGRNLRILFAGEEAGTLKTESESYPIFIDSSLAGRNIPSGILGRIRIRNAAGTSIPYSAFSRQERQPTTDSIPHSDRLPSILVVGELVESDLTAIRGRIEPMLQTSSLPPGVSWRITGVADVMGDTFRNLLISLGIAIFLVYAVMVVQFERFTQPFIIMGAVPFILIGVALSLTAFGGRITMMSFFGVIALGGMVVNNAIVLVEFTNQRRREGLGIRDAVLEAAQIRLKPILITTLTTLLGLIPLAFSLGEGSQIYAPLGQVIGGGLITSTLITLGLVPLLYEWVEERREKAIAASDELNEKPEGGAGRFPVLPLIVAALLVLQGIGPAKLGAEEGSPWNVEELTVMALVNDPDLLAARYDARSAAERLRGARAERGPTVDLELGASYLSDPLLSVPAGALGSLDLGLPGGPVVMPSDDIDIWGRANDFRYDLTAVFEQPLFTWGKISSGIDVAEAGTAAAGWYARSRENELRSGILIALESLVVVERMLKLTVDQEEFGSRLADLTLRNFEEGFLLESEYRDTRNRLQQILLTASSLRNERQNLLLDLEQVTGLSNLQMELLDFPMVDDSLNTYLPESAEVLITAAWSSNPDIMALSSLENMARAELGMARGGAAAKPDLAFRTEFGYGGGFDRIPDDINGTWRVTIGARSTLFDSGRSRSDIRSAEANLEAAGARAEGGRRTVESFIRSTLYSMNLNRDNIGYYIGLRNTDTSRAAQKQSSWESGYGREEEWLLAELDSLASELRRLREVLEYIRRYRQLRQVAGLE